MTTHYNDYLYSNKTVFGIKSDSSRYAWASYYLLILISSLVGDTIILIASWKYRAFRLHKIVVVTIQHIAFCDLMVTVSNVVSNVVTIIRNEWVLGDFLCYLRPYTGYYLPVVSVLLICNMTTSKLILLKYPLRSETITVKKAHLFCGASWLAALILPVTALFVNVLDGNDIYFSYKTYYCDLGFTANIWDWLKPLLAVIVLFTPNCLVVFTTIYLLIIAKQVARGGQTSLKWQGIITTVLTASTYCISILPTVVFNVGEAVFTVDDPSKSFFHTSYFRIADSILYLNTISNFYIYSLSIPSFREFIKSSIHQSYRMFSLTTTSTSENHGMGIMFSSIFDNTSSKVLKKFLKLFSLI